MSDPTERDPAPYVVIERAALAVLVAHTQDGFAGNDETERAAVAVGREALDQESNEFRRFFIAGGGGGERFVLDRQTGSLGRPELDAVVIARCDYPNDAVRLLAALDVGETEYDRADPSYPDGVPTSADLGHDVEEPF